jgi:hypothetical protein
MAGFAEAILACGCNPHVVFPVPDAVKEQMRCNGDDTDKVTFHTCDEEDFSQPVHGVALRARWLKRWRGAARKLQIIERELGAPVDRVFFAWMDPFLLDLPTSLLINGLFRHRFSGLLFAPFDILHNRARRRPGLKWITSRGHVLRLNRCLSICTLDETLDDQLARTFRRKTVVLPDVLDSTLPPEPDVKRVQAEILRQSKGRLVLAVLGSLEARKGVIDVLRLIERGTMPHIFLLMAGEIQWHSFSEPDSHFLREIMKRALPGCCLRFGGLLKEAELNALLISSDVLYLCYRAFRQSSALLAKAAYFRIPVLAFDENLIGWRVRRHSLGWTVSQGERDAFLRGLDRRTLDGFRAARRFLDGSSAYQKEQDRGLLPGRLAEALALRPRAAVAS